MNKGFSSVFVLLCLSSLVLFLLCVCEICSGYAAGSICENVCTMAGSSVLSEYQPDIQRRYGVFLVSSYEQKLQALNRFYIGQGLNGANILVRPQLEECTVSVEGFSGLDTDLLAKQVDTLGLMFLGKDMLDESGALQLLKDLLDPLDGRDADEAAESLNDLPPAPSDGSQSGKSAAELKREYDEAMDPDLGLHEGKSLVSVRKDGLPTSLLGIRPSSSLLRYAGQALLQDGIAPDAALQSWYIVHACSDLTHQRDDTLLGLETEYILFGKGSDRENEEEMKTALFKVRTAIDLARNLRSESKMAAYTAAAAAFPAVPQPLAVLILAAIDAAAQAKGEVQTLCSGGRVPIYGSSVEGQKGFGTYRDYAALLLMLLPRQTRMARLMDMMQVNAAHMDGASFAFQDYCYGYTLQAEFNKKSILGLFGDGTRRGRIEQTHAYR